MREISCPNCEKVFRMDEAGDADILKQVRDSEFDKQLHERLELVERVEVKVMESRCMRGSDLFRPAELSERLGDGVSMTTILEACHEWVRSGGVEGLAHSVVGKGYMIRAEAVEDWLVRKENLRAGILPERRWRGKK